jgi:hypothetical protein
MSKEEIKEILDKYIHELVGDTSVACQLDVALREHKHNYPTREEYEELKAEVEYLMTLVGDTSVAEQINTALNG